MEASMLRRPSALCAAISAALFAIAGLAAGPAAAEQATACEVTRVVGRATVVREGASLPLSANVLLYERDQVATGPDGRVEIRCEDGSTIVVGDRSTVSLASFVTPPTQRGWVGVLLMIEGILRVTLPGTKRWNRLEIVTETAVASARSTAWIVDARKETTGVFAVEGRVRVVGKAGGEVTLSPRQGTDVRPGAQPTPPVVWGQPRASAALARTTMP